MALSMSMIVIRSKFLEDGYNHLDNNSHDDIDGDGYVDDGEGYVDVEDGDVDDGEGCVDVDVDDEGDVEDGDEGDREELVGSRGRR